MAAFFRDRYGSSIAARGDDLSGVARNSTTHAGMRRSEQRIRQRAIAKLFCCATIAFGSGMLVASIPLVGVAAAQKPHFVAQTAQAQPDISGTWRGAFTNTQGSSFPVNFTLNADDGRITGTGNVPSSSINPRPTVSGTIEGRRVRLETNSGFKFDLTLNAEGNRLSGTVSGANQGTLNLSR